jgi:hypothetical protein
MLHDLFMQIQPDKACIVIIRTNLSFRNKWVEVDTNTDEPSNIRWKNIPYSKAKRCLRQTFALLVAIIVLLISFGITIGTKYAENALSTNFSSNVDCSFVKFTEESVLKEFTDSSIISKEKYQTYCFCRENLVNKGLSATSAISLGAGSIKPCSSWIESYITSQSLTVGTILLVPLVNIILSFLLASLTEFERNQTVSINISSNMWKSFLLQFINTVLNY